MQTASLAAFAWEACSFHYAGAEIDAEMVLTVTSDRQQLEEYGGLQLDGCDERVSKGLPGFVGIALWAKLMPFCRAA